MAYATKATIAATTIYILYCIHTFIRNIVGGSATGLPRPNESSPTFSSPLPDTLVKNEILETPWKEEDEKARDPGYKATYAKSLMTVLGNMAGAGLLPAGLLNKWPTWLPGDRKMASAGCVKLELQRRNRLFLEQERAFVVSGEETPRPFGDKNILKTFVAAVR
ncbi:hypothetical protein E4U41_003394 [Claviceps citrina]|nr:hypothetical protein E4U41_003394 [Claviceps citrina]